MEIWKEIDQSGYFISNEGRVASKRQGRWKILKSQLDKKGYLRIRLWGAGRRTSVHRLVAFAFIGPPPTPTHEVNHRDGIRSNCVVGNLEWLTPLENVWDSLARRGKVSRRAFESMVAYYSLVAPTLQRFT